MFTNHFKYNKINKYYSFVYMEGRAKELSDNIEPLKKYKTLFQENQDCLDTVLNNLSKMGINTSAYYHTIVIRNWTKNRIKDTEKQLRKLCHQPSKLRT